MNKQHENPKLLTITSNTPISLSQLLGKKTISVNPLEPKKFIITLKPRAVTTNSKLKVNTVVPSIQSEFHKVFVKAVDLFKGKLMFGSPFKLRNTILEKIDEVSEGSLTSLESKIYDLKLSEPYTDIQRLRGGCGKRCKRIEDKNVKESADKVIEQESVKQKEEKDLVTEKVRGTKVADIKKGKNKFKADNKKRCVLRKLKKHRTGDTTADKKNQTNAINKQISLNQESVADDNKIALEDITKSNEKLNPTVEEKETLSYRAASPNFFNFAITNAETCAKLDDLEKQLHEMTIEIRDMRKDMLAPNDIFKIKFLSDQFREVNELLMDLKLNCLYFRNMKSYTDSRTTLYSEQILKDFKLSYEYQYKPEISKYEQTPLKRTVCCQKCNQYQSHSCASAVNNQNEFEVNLSTEAEHNINLKQPNCSVARQYENRENSGTINNDLFCNHQIVSENCTSCEHLNTKQYNKKHQQSYSMGLKQSSSSCLFIKETNRPAVFVELPVITYGLSQSIMQIVGDYKCENISLTVVLESNHLYHINVSVLYTSQSLGCLYATETALSEALKEHVFDNFITFFVLNSKRPVKRKNKMLSYSLEFMNSSG